MDNIYKTDLVMKLTGATANQLKYWGHLDLITPDINGRRAHYSFKDIVKLRVLVSLRKKWIKSPEDSSGDQPAIGDAS